MSSLSGRVVYVHLGIDRFKVYPDVLGIITVLDEILSFNLTIYLYRSVFVIIFPEVLWSYRPDVMIVQLYLFRY